MSSALLSCFSSLQTCHNTQIYCFSQYYSTKYKKMCFLLMIEKSQVYTPVVKMLPARSSSTHSTLLPNAYIYRRCCCYLVFFSPFFFFLASDILIVCCTLGILYLSLAVSWLPFARYIIGCTNAQHSILYFCEWPPSIPFALSFNIKKGKYISDRGLLPSSTSSQP